MRSGHSDRISREQSMRQGSENAVTETDPRQWLVALALSLLVHVAVGLWFEQLPPAAQRSRPTGLTVSLMLEASGTPGGDQPREPHAAKEYTAPRQPKAPPATKHKKVNETLPEKTRPSTDSRPAAEGPRRASSEPSQGQPPRSQAKLKAQPTDATVQSQKESTSVPHSTQSPAPETMASANTPSATASQAAEKPALIQGNGDITGAGSKLSAAAPLRGNPKPRYPSLARRRGYEGRVLIQVALRPDGRTAHVEVKESSGHRVLDAAALAAVKDWRFRPARRAGRPISSTVSVPVSFRLESRTSR